MSSLTSLIVQSFCSDMNISNAINTTYQPSNLYDTTYYRLFVESGYNCGSEYTDTVQIVVNPLPNDVGIIGKSVVCANENDVIYTIDSTHTGYSFYWDCIEGNFLGGRNTNQTVVHWGTNSGIDTLFLLQTINATGCKKQLPYAVEISNNSAPSKTNIIRKPNSDILICDDSTLNIIYQWGYDLKYDGSSTAISGANLRYVQLPHSFDTTIYRYWVQTYFEYSESLSCETQSYFNAPNLPISIDNADIINMAIYPNPSTGKFYIRNIGSEKLDVNIYDIKGSAVSYRINYGDGSINLNTNAPNGIYILYLRTKKAVLTNKIILSR